MNTVLEGKLPVSRAKMASITRIALKAAKVSFLYYHLTHQILITCEITISQFYKHIVMTVEKFLSKVRLASLHIHPNIIHAPSNAVSLWIQGAWALRDWLHCEAV